MLEPLSPEGSCGALRDRTLGVDRVNGFLQRILSSPELVVVVVDTGDAVQLWNGGAERLTGVRAFEAEGRRVLDLDLSLPVDRVRAALLRQVVVEARPPAPVRRRAHRPLRPAPAPAPHRHAAAARAPTGSRVRW